MDWTKIKNFKPYEFRCPCCGLEKMDQDFVEKLDSLRDRIGLPIEISSGYRCEERDKAVGGKGNHTTGKAVDIICKTSEFRYDILWNAAGYFSRIGIGKTFIHLDDCKDKPQEVVWLY